MLNKVRFTVDVAFMQNLHVNTLHIFAEMPFFHTQTFIQKYNKFPYKDDL